MPALDDFDPAAPTWLAICAALERAPGRELSLTQLHTTLIADSRGIWFGTSKTVSNEAKRMRDVGILKMRIAKHAGRMPAQMHTLTQLGREMFLEARELAFALLDSTPTKRKD